MRIKNKIQGHIEVLIHNSFYVCFVLLTLFQLFFTEKYSNLVKNYYENESYIFSFTTVFFSIIFAIYLSLPNKPLVKKILKDDFKSFTDFLYKMFISSICFICIVSLIPQQYARDFCLLNTLKISLFISFLLNIFRVSSIIKTLNSVDNDVDLEDKIDNLTNDISEIREYFKSMYNQKK
ncbi:hypothetical protein [Turicibacter sanguinis]|uniref:hypothetical protein n=1 Tax=Turicibacter sanguinis TaxID=154288 RepID=UPI00241C5695|nr:hypothetical protein [Turicibacter sanguinis]